MPIYSARQTKDIAVGTANPYCASPILVAADYYECRAQSGAGEPYILRDLLPLTHSQKPMRHYRVVALKIQKILDLMTGLRKIREHIPRKETVTSVLKERREFVRADSLSQPDSI